MNYCKNPVNHIAVEGTQAWKGYEDILGVLSRKIQNILAHPERTCVLAVDTYPGVDDEELIPRLLTLQPALFLNMEDVLCSKEEYSERIRPFMTEDRVFGRMYYGELADFQQMEKRDDFRRRVKEAAGLIIIYGFGAAALAELDILVYADMARWEIQQRFRRGMPNYHTDNGGEDNLKKFKQGYFLEWRIADKHKRAILDRIDFFLDVNRPNDPSMLTGNSFRQGLREVSQKPFRTVPYFDPGVWGGQWMKKVCGLDAQQKNFAWAFDGVPEENSLYLEVNNILIECPAMDLVLYCPASLLGSKTYARFGAEYPIRFDFLDTIGGQNLSLQVHPVTDYIHAQFGMSYTQDESYYILDAEDDACVYLGLKDGVSPEEMVGELRRSSAGEMPFDTEKYINKFPAKRHDHFLIPAGTVHCSGSGCMVLEISATPYIFTFKLWDWGRVGWDGKPRPIHMEHGSKVIQWDRRTEWVRNNLVGQARVLQENSDYKEERTGLHELEFIETRRYTVKGVCTLDTGNTVNMLNLVGGKAAVVESPEQKFEAFEVHYAETFIVPAAVGKYSVRSMDDEQVCVVCAYVRGTMDEGKRIEK